MGKETAKERSAKAQMGALIEKTASNSKNEVSRDKTNPTPLAARMRAIVLTEDTK